MKNILSIAVLLGIVAVSVFGIFGNIVAAPFVDNSAYPIKPPNRECKILYSTSNPPNPIRHTIPAEPGYEGKTFCFALLYDSYSGASNPWIFRNDGCQPISSNNTRCVSGIGKNEIWGQTTAKLLNFTVFASNEEFLPGIHNGYP